MFFFSLLFDCLYSGSLYSVYTHENYVEKFEEEHMGVSILNIKNNSWRSKSFKEKKKHLTIVKEIPSCNANLYYQSGDRILRSLLLLMHSTPVFGLQLFLDLVVSI